MFDNQLPASAQQGLTIVNNPTTVKIQVELRMVKLDDNVVQITPNAWIYRKVSSPRLPGQTVLKNYLGPIINVTKGTPCKMHWYNTLTGMMPMPGMPDMQEDPPVNPKPMDPAMNMQPSTGIVAHLHGGKVKHDSDGWPLDPVTYQGSPYPAPHFLPHRVYTYPNDQRAAMLWFHDHGMDNTAPQVMAGLAGLYFIRDQSDTDIATLAAQEIPLVIQDRNLGCGYQNFDYWAGIPTDPAYWRPEFLGESIFVNGRATPSTNVERSVYRLRILNGSNARTYALALIDPFWWSKQPAGARIWYSDCMRVIGNDGGLFTTSVAVASTDYVLIAPGERLDVLLDLTALTNVDCLRLVNLAVASAIDPANTGPEGIFQTDKGYILSAPINSVLPKPQLDNDPSLLNALKLGPANIMQFCVGNLPATAALDTTALDSILANNANDEGFVTTTPGGQLIANPANVLGTAPARNRLVLLMNNSNPGAEPPHPLALPWQDVQMWELSDPALAPAGATWRLPFTIDTETVSPVTTIDTTVGKSYAVCRATFFRDNPPPQVTPATGYPVVQAATFTPKAGTYERWFVANIGNFQDVAVPTNTNIKNETMDMHPYHMHLVNFTVVNRWKVNAAGTLDGPLEQPPLDFDGISRHDTVGVQANEILELLVYFPPGYTGDYVYHCHLVEHEDMGMMLHFTVVP
jgi:FtsP/CotA-like multicopper oxidase with cupredoxin domain